MNINRQNYESILIDYIDGLLNKDDSAKVERFLLMNPDIADEVEGIREATATPTNTVFSNKNRLKKSLGEAMGINDSADYLCIAELEGDISDHELRGLNTLSTQNPNVEKSRQQYRKTKLSAPTAITFVNKSELKRLSIIPIRLKTFRIATTAAATIALLVALYQPLNIEHTSSIAITNSTIGPKQSTPSNGNTPKATVTNETRSKTSTQTDRTRTNDSGVEPTASINKWEPTNTEPVEPIKPLQPKMAIAPSVLASKLEIRNSNTSMQTTTIVQQTGGTREYTALGLAKNGLKRAVNFLGFDVQIEKNNEGKIKKIAVESSMLAFTTTRNKNER